MSEWAAIWSAVAATFSAITAIFFWRLEKLNFHSNARPDIVITGWKREEAGEHDKLYFSNIENVGLGSALYININSSSNADDDRSITSMSSIQESLIPPGGSLEVKGEIFIWWKHAPGSPGKKFIPIIIEVYCWDTTGIRHLTKYALNVHEGGIYGNNIVAPGVVLGRRSVNSDAVWMLKLKMKLSKIPLVNLFVSGAK